MIVFPSEGSLRRAAPVRHRIFARPGRADRDAGRRAQSVLPFGLAEVDSRLPGGGLALGALHEVAGGGNGAIDGAAAALFAAGIAARTRGKVLWCVTRPDLFAPALAQAGLKPDRVIYRRGRRREDRPRLFRGRACGTAGWAPWSPKSRGSADDRLAAASARRRRLGHDRHRHPPLATADRGGRFRAADGRRHPLARHGAALDAACRCPASAGRAGWSS